MSESPDELETLVKTLSQQISSTGWVEAELARKRAAGEPLVQAFSISEPEEAAASGGGGGALPPTGATLFPLGPAGMRAPRLGLGVMSAAFYGSGDAAADEAASLAAIDALVALCAPAPAFLDTAWIYASPTGLHSEAIVGKAVAKHGRGALVIATKFGSNLNAPPDSSLETITRMYAESVARLGTAPDLYYQRACCGTG